MKFFLLLLTLLVLVELSVSEPDTELETEADGLFDKVKSFGKKLTKNVKKGFNKAKNAGKKLVRKGMSHVKTHVNKLKGKSGPTVTVSTLVNIGGVTKGKAAVDIFANAKCNRIALKAPRSGKYVKLGNLGVGMNSDGKPGEKYTEFEVRYKHNKTPGVINLKNTDNRRYLTAEKHLGQVTCRRKERKEWEKFTIYVRGNKIAFKTAWQTYLIEKKGLMWGWNVKHAKRTTDAKVDPWFTYECMGHGGSGPARPAPVISYDTSATAQFGSRLLLWSVWIITYKGGSRTVIFLPDGKLTWVEQKHKKTCTWKVLYERLILQMDGVTFEYEQSDSGVNECVKGSGPEAKSVISYSRIKYDYVIQEKFQNKVLVYTIWRIRYSVLLEGKIEFLANHKIRWYHGGQITVGGFWITYNNQLIILIPGDNMPIQIVSKGGKITCSRCGGQPLEFTFLERRGDTSITCTFGRYLLVGTTWIIKISSTDMRKVEFKENGELIWIGKTTRCTWQLIMKQLYITMGTDTFIYKWENGTGICLPGSKCKSGTKISFHKIKPDTITITIGRYVIINTIWKMTITGIGTGEIEFMDDRRIRWNGQYVDGYWITEMRGTVVHIYIYIMHVKYHVHIENDKMVDEDHIVTIIWYRPSNPCNTNNGGCQQTCNPKKPGPLGSYSCSCPQYHKLNSDNKTCKFVHPCDTPQKGGCQDVCDKGNSKSSTKQTASLQVTSLQIKYKCRCTKPGYVLQSDRKSCAKLKCPRGTQRQGTSCIAVICVVKLPGAVSEIRLKYGQMITSGSVQCKRGYKLIGDLTKTKCTSTGMMAGVTSVRCDMIRCLFTVPGSMGKIDIRYGQSIKSGSVQCQKGYKLSGSVTTTKCGSNGQITGASSLKCKMIRCSVTVPGSVTKIEIRYGQSITSGLVKCRSGYKLVGDITRTKCGSSGQIQGASSLKCQLMSCKPGQYLSGGRCSSCVAGTYNRTGKGKCTPCPAGQYSPAGSSSSSACTCYMENVKFAVQIGGAGCKPLRVKDMYDCAKLCNKALDCSAFNYIKGNCYFAKDGATTPASGYTSAKISCLKSSPKDKSKLDECQKK